MDSGVVQHVLALRHPQEPGALLKGLGAQLGHLQQLFPAGKAPVLLPVGHDVLGHGRGDARHPPQQGTAEAVFKSTPTPLTQSSTTPSRASSRLRLGHIVLVLPHADGLGVDLHQLRQGVLEPPGDGNRRAQGHVEVRELLGAQLGGGVDRGPRLADHHVGNGLCRTSLMSSATNSSDSRLAVPLPMAMHGDAVSIGSGGAGFSWPPPPCCGAWWGR